MFEMNAVCENCGKTIGVNPQTVKKQAVKVVRKEGVQEELNITTYECKECGRVHIVQIDDMETENLLRELTKMMARVAKKKHNHKDVSKKEIAKLTKIRTELAERRLLLKQTYQGKYYLDESLNERVFEVSM